MGLIGGNDPAVTANSAPIWTGAGTITFQQGSYTTYDLNQLCTDPDGDVLTYTENSITLPTGVSISGNLLIYDGVGGVASAAGTFNADDGTASPVSSSSITVNITATGDPEATIIVAPSGGDYTTIQAAINAALPQDIIEVEADFIGGTKYYEEALTLPIDGVDADRTITLRGRPGDRIIIYVDDRNLALNSRRNILELSDSKYWVFKNLQFGRDETLNGWTYSLDPDGGRFSVEHRRWLSWTGTDSGDESHHIDFQDCVMYAGSQYDGGITGVNTHHFRFLRCEFYFSGINGGDDLNPNAGGNPLTFQGSNSLFKGCKVKHGGHDNLNIFSSYNVIRNCISDGSWTDYKPTNPGKGNRAFTCAGDKGSPPYGFNVIDSNVFRNHDVDLDGTEQSCGKFHGNSNIVRRNFMFGEGYMAQFTPLKIAGADSSNYWRFYHNTVYGCDYSIFSIDRKIPTSTAGDYFIEAVFKNNVFAETGGGRNGAEHIRWIRDSTPNTGGYPDEWRGSVFENNILHTAAAGDDYEVLYIPAGSNIRRTGISNIESEWPLVFKSNRSDQPSFLSLNDRQSDVFTTAWEACELSPTSPGGGEGIHLTQANGSGSSSAKLIVDDARYFYAGADPNLWDLAEYGEVGDYIAVGTDTGTATVAQISTINHATNELTLVDPISWSDNDYVWLVSRDGVNALESMGANPEYS